MGKIICFYIFFRGPGVGFPWVRRGEFVEARNWLPWGVCGCDFAIDAIWCENTIHFCTKRGFIAEVVFGAETLFISAPNLGSADFGVWCTKNILINFICFLGKCFLAGEPFY